MSKKKKAKAEKTKRTEGAQPQPRSETAGGTADSSAILAQAEGAGHPKRSTKAEKPSPRKAAAETAGKRVAESQMALISRAIADPTRMGILRSIAKGGGSCLEMRGDSKISAATFSHHLRELEAAGLIQTRREGRFVRAMLERKLWKGYVSELKSMVG